MKDEPLWIRSEWRTDELDGRSVRFRVLVTEEKIRVEGHGVFRASRRADGMQRIEISVQGKEPDHVTQLRLCVDESLARRIKRLPSGSEFEYSLEEPGI